jgi:hypothetical protein
MADQKNDSSTIEQGGGNILERGRPDGVGKPSNDQPNMPNPQPVKIPGNVTRRKK